MMVPLLGAILIYLLLSAVSVLTLWFAATLHPAFLLALLPLALIGYGYWPEAQTVWREARQRRTAPRGTVVPFRRAA